MHFHYKKTLHLVATKSIFPDALLTPVSPVAGIKTCLGDITFQRRIGHKGVVTLLRGYLSFTYSTEHIRGEGQRRVQFLGKENNTTRLAQRSTFNCNRIFTSSQTPY